MCVRVRVKVGVMFRVRVKFRVRVRVTFASMTKVMVCVGYAHFDCKNSMKI